MSKAVQLSKGYSDRGAYMGRPNDILEPDAAIKFRLYLMPMSPCGAYDNGGAYWGCGCSKTGWMYHAIGEGPEWVNQMFVRAINREEAKKQVLDAFPNAKFYR